MRLADRRGYFVLSEIYIYSGKWSSYKEYMKWIREYLAP